MPKRGLGSTSHRSAGIEPGSKAFLRVSGRRYRARYTIKAWDDFLQMWAVGSVAQVCCGASQIGDIRVDHDPAAPGVNVLADMYALPLRDSSFDTVACDPIYRIGFHERVRLQRELSRVARQRILFKASWIPRARGFKLRQTFLLASHTCQNVAVLSVLERAGRQTLLRSHEGS